ncbi:hypothetical protein [Ornithinimicrobium murale]|uniref:hypothetical protein n=1 Tax=Ornithinimicrobium murale TaxID=1050153 RepID=UPI000E0D7E6B|nr:hypothetical protein [Ornithinimicrobium murale]
MSENQLTLERTLLARDAGAVRWSLAVLNDNSRPLTSRLPAEAVFPAEADRTTVTVVSTSINGMFDAEDLDGSFTVAPGGKAELELSANLLPEHVG